MKFLKLHDKSEAFIHYQKNITQKMGPLVSNGWGQESTGGWGGNEFSIMDMLKLVEQVVVLVERQMPRACMKDG